MRIVKDPEERRQEIVDGAIRVFARKGYEKAAISDIAGEIGISQGLCYRYFPSKEAIYDAALDQYAAYIVDQNLARTQLAGKTLKEQILLMSGKTQEYSTTERDLKPLYNLFHKEESGFSARASQQPRSRYASRKYLFVLYAATLVGPLVDSIRLALHHKDATMLLHFVYVYYTCLCIAWYLLRALLGRPPENKTYGK